MSNRHELSVEPITRGIYACCEKFADFIPCDCDETVGLRITTPSGRTIEVFNYGGVTIAAPARRGLKG